MILHELSGKVVLSCEVCDTSYESEIAFPFDHVKQSTWMDRLKSMFAQLARTKCPDCKKVVKN